MSVDTGLGAVLLLVGRLMFGGFLAFAGLNHFMNAREMTGYAESKNVPAAGLGVVTSGTLLILGGLGLLLSAYPVLAAGMIAIFFLIVTPLMHNFWAVPEDQQQNEVTNFIKNAELLGASLVFLALGDQVWGYAMNIGLWMP